MRSAACDDELAVKSRDAARLRIPGVNFSSLLRSGAAPFSLARSADMYFSLDKCLNSYST
jgi:hypothetical protein